MKKVWFVLLAVILSVALFTVTASAYYVQETGTVGDFVIEVYDEGFGSTAVISGYTGSGGAITLPTTFKGYPIVSMGSDVFKGNTNITSLVVPEGYTQISDNAFEGCSKLTRVQLPSSLRYLSDKAFLNCTKLKSVNIPRNIQYVGSRVFKGCTALETITIPRGVEFWGQNVFGGCTGLKTVTVEEGVTDIPSFNDCTGLTTINFPSSVEYIESYTFRNCPSLTGITLPDGLKTIGYEAFAGCEGLKEINIPASVTTIYDGAFAYCHGLTAVHITDLEAWCHIKYERYDYVSTGNPLLLAEHLYLNGEPVEHLVIPESVTDIQDFLFVDCKTLKTVTLHNGVTRIGVAAFSGCENLKKINIPSSVTEIGDSAFGGTSSLTKISLPNSITKLGTSVFYESGLKSFTVPNNRKSIPYGLFQSCKDLSSVTISNSVTTIEERAFMHCFALRSVTIPGSVTTIEEDAFYDCRGLQTLEIPASVTTIGEYAFYDCYDLERVTFKGNVPKMGSNVFVWCSGLKSVIFPEGFTTIPEGTFGKCLSLRTVILPKSITGVGDAAFFDCPLENVYYAGTKKQAKAISVGVDNTAFTGASWQYSHSPAPLKLTVHPKTDYEPLGFYATMTVKATGDGVEYVWYTKDVGASTYTKDSTTGTSYTAQLTAKSKNRRVYCVVTDAYGNRVQSKTVFMRERVDITTQPKSVTTRYGKTAKVTVKATGDDLTYTWYFKNFGGTKFKKSSVTSATYSCKMTDASKYRQLYCVIKDKYGHTAQSYTVSLYLDNKVGITTQPKTAYTVMGKTAKVTVKAAGTGLKYTWYIKNAGATKYIKSSVTSATYSCKLTKASKNRRLYCVVTDAYGNRVQSEIVYLREKVSIITQPKTTYTAIGKTAKVTVKASGDGLKYTWYIKNAGATKYIKSSATSATYSCKFTKSRENRRIYCVVMDKYGNRVQSTTVTLKAK